MAKSEAENKDGPFADNLFGPRAAQREHASALRRYADEMQQDRRERLLRDLLPKDTKPKPRATLSWEYKNNILSVIATNQGVLAEFHGIFDVIGPVNAKRPTELFCKWSHSDFVNTRIANGGSRRIDLAELKFDGMTHTWEIYTTTETGEPLNIRAHYSSCAISTPITEAPEIIINGRLVAIPDAENGVQPFRFVLQPFGVKAEG
jgi:hypothetical protein